MQFFYSMFAPVWGHFVPYPLVFNDYLKTVRNSITKYDIAFQ